MGIREDLLRRIERKQVELTEGEREWERRKAGAEAYIQALQETLKALPRDAADFKPENILRAGGALARARDFILAKRAPQGVREILAILGKPNDKKSRASITSAIGSYVRRGEIFVRTAPNTFGLIELGHSSVGDEEPPSGFGQIRTANMQESSGHDHEADELHALDEEEDVPF